ncbi:MAG: hypothetical protein GWN67_16380 [Phycisphaerae bacterium]|nr:hypothetical protein [Phycisphaerae bacterium]NIP54166.1 hypothetical protein [Phycisphaerae bacterium]NIS53054.1 hypothetical protein [Phycisphaerae bacterium]NIU10543.1 hypothetical protein [Phycisphaerae bacterium]NIU57908.1 hypothetical protein [Phycisphaerae bacterium]
MHIDSYQFGKIVIDGQSYTSDIIILDDAVQSEWWRKQGHSLASEDLDTILKAKPSVLVVGCGASGLMEIPGQTRQALKERNIQLEAFDSYKAIRKFNELSEAGVNVAAALHLTC